MKLEELLLRKEELPILRETRFVVPIHPALLKSNINLDPRLANSLFPQAAQEWYADLQAYTETVQDEQTKRWYQDVFLKEQPLVRTDKHGRQTILDGMWEDLVQTSETGFAHVFSINRNVGGSLYYNSEEIHSCSRNYILPPAVQFSPEKFDAYAVEKFPNTSGVIANAYAHHNIDHYPGALFLRNWAILYLNEAMKEVGKHNLEIAKDF